MKKDNANAVREAAKKKAIEQMQLLADIQRTFADAKQTQADRRRADAGRRRRQTDAGKKDEITPTQFETALRDYENAYINQTANLGNALQTLATACTRSVIRKCIRTGGSKVIINLANTYSKDIANIKRIQTLIDESSTMRYNADGNIEFIIDDEKSRQAEKLLLQCLDDGCDLMQDAVITILNETQKAQERAGGQFQPLFLETTYQQRILKRKVYIKTEESKGAWVDAETTPIQEVYRAIRRSIENSRAVQVAQNGYTYIEDYATDESGAEETIYRRFAKYADIGGYVTDYNGAETVYTADNWTADEMDALIATLNLTSRQMQVLKYRLQGYGVKAIATAIYGRSTKEDATARKTQDDNRKKEIRKTLKAIQKKCLILGIQPIKEYPKEDESETINAVIPQIQSIIIPSGYKTTAQWQAVNK